MSTPAANEPERAGGRPVPPVFLAKIPVIAEDGTKKMVGAIADNAEEYIALLRNVLAASGRTAGQVATYGRIPRSTAYHFVAKGTNQLPANRERLTGFLRGCKLDEAQVELMLSLWWKLRVQERSRQARAGGGTDADEPARAADAEEPAVSELVPYRRAEVVGPLRAVDPTEIEELVQRTQQGELGVDALLDALRALTGHNEFHVHGNVNISMHSGDSESTTETPDNEAPQPRTEEHHDHGNTNIPPLPHWLATALITFVAIASTALAVLAVLVPNRTSELVPLVFVAPTAIAMGTAAVRRLYR